MMSEGVSAMLDDDRASRLREAHYNARVVDVVHVHDSLAIMRVVPDFGRLELVPGQYTVLGLGAWEGCVGDAAAPPAPDFDDTTLIRRAYSLSCSLLDGRGRLVRTRDCPYLEFYLALVLPRGGRLPGLTPRLFRLAEGDRLFVGRQPRGRYTLGALTGDENLLFLSTGTGEAPHNAMLAELLAAGHRGRIAVVSGVRYRRDLAYLACHQRLAEKFANYTYRPLTTREPENVDPKHPGFIGKRYLQEYVESGDLERELGLELSPERTQVYICGNPQMVGMPHHGGRFPVPRGVVEVLTRRGFRLDLPSHPGNIHCELYW